jgi:hypothetical protein
MANNKGERVIKSDEENCKVEGSIEKEKRSQGRAGE